MKTLLKLFALPFIVAFLAGCESCPNMVQYGEIGIKISPMACVSKSSAKEQTKNSDDDGGDDQDQDKGNDD
jgi:hypothetical protein